ncbi:MAG: YybH family protein [Steroidobacteraceae bacterium]
MTDQLTVELGPEVKRVLELLDTMDVGGLAALFTEDAQAVDEISGGWTRGRAALDTYFERLEGTVTDVRSELSDLHTTTWGQVGLATFVLDQTYKMNGQEQSLSAPTSIVFRRQEDAWKVALVHSVPIPT